ncbi:MAG: hypothetical protein DLM67_05890 [Candidatus Nephthysia bennettiae]|uniref:Uncharacterized protein n=1 Tax=Candidatus Nephthysia bennettiae TaxID=3127016 RepID=A0A934KD79_9BACT|nr:hypothetical protein [Candidatus Dormibacteraeota bacterium]MBJ7613674.1 hypothetical protein [Candidatus Dormibacteraeota bacterium]PZR98399.1 MAG: hypothetical protein DLM67_05890 [Candidatus Dormibacteraeota bacterium]
MTKALDRTAAHHDHPIDTRLKISALWTAMLFIFAYVDLFSLYRPDFRADIESGKVFMFDINQTFLFFATLYIIVPSLMIYLTLVMRPRLNRIINIVVAALYAITIAGGAVGEWGYYILGSVIEALLLAVVVRHAWTWPERASN